MLVGIIFLTEQSSILVADHSDPESQGEWVSVVRIVRILGDRTVSPNNNSDEDFLMLI